MLTYFAIVFFIVVICLICWQTRKVKRTGKNQFLALTWPLDEAWKNDLPPTERLKTCLQELQKRKDSGADLDLVLLSEVQVALAKLRNSNNPVEQTLGREMITAMQYLLPGEELR